MCFAIVQAESSKLTLAVAPMWPEVKRLLLMRRDSVKLIVDAMRVEMQPTSCFLTNRESGSQDGC